MLLRLPRIDGTAPITNRIFLNFSPTLNMGGCQNSGPFLGPLNIRCRTIIGIQKGTRILTTTHIHTMTVDFPPCLNVCAGDPEFSLRRFEWQHAWLIGVDETSQTSGGEHARMPLLDWPSPDMRLAANSEKARTTTYTQSYDQVAQHL